MVRMSSVPSNELANKADNYNGYCWLTTAWVGNSNSDGGPKLHTEEWKAVSCVPPKWKNCWGTSLLTYTSDLRILRLYLISNAKNGIDVGPMGQRLRDGSRRRWGFITQPILVPHKALLGFLRTQCRAHQILPFLQHSLRNQVRHPGRPLHRCC